MTVYHGITPAEFMTRARDAGLHPEPGAKDRGSVTVQMRVQGCKSEATLLVPMGGDRFGSIQFWVAWQDEISADEANMWNSMRRYAFAYRDESGRANLQMDVSVVGLADEGVDHYLGLWSHMVGSFMTEMT